MLAGRFDEYRFIKCKCLSKNLFKYCTEYGLCFLKRKRGIARICVMLLFRCKYICSEIEIRVSKVMISIFIRKFA